MRVFFEARCCGRRLECNRVTRGHSLPCQPENRESLPPQPLRPTSESQCPVPWASHSPPLGSSWKAPLSSSRGASGWRRWGEKGVAPPPGGQGSALLRWARPGCRALSVRCLGRGRPGPAALCPRGPPFQQQAEVWGEIVASESGLLDPKRETGAAPRGLGGASAKQMATVRGQGAFKEGSLSSPRANSTCSLPGDRLCYEEAA